jgi:uncharacterized RmlC-like cupin family protein
MPKPRSAKPKRRSPAAATPSRRAAAARAPKRRAARAAKQRFSAAGMKTVKVPVAAMRKRLARFKDLKPQSGYYATNAGVPRAAYEMMTAQTLYLLMAPASQGGPMAQKPAIVGAKGLSLIVAKCPPGDRPLLHAHFKTNETFMCLTGRFRIRWGDHGENELYLEPFDTIAVPPAICRDFTNVSDQDALLLAIIQGEDDDDFNDIAIAPGETAMMLQRFGPAVVKQLEATGVRFMPPG